MPLVEVIRLAKPFRAIRPISPGVLVQQIDGGSKNVPPNPSLQASVPADFELQLRRAREEGRLEGERQLGEQLIQQRTEMQQLLDGVVVPLRQAVGQVMRDAEHAVTSLALDIAQKLVADLPITPDMVVGVVKDALMQVEESAEFHVRLSAADLELLQRSGSQLATGRFNGSVVHFHAAADVSRGGCIVQTRFGIIDARRETKLELLRHSLLPDA
jgi:flagellar assembly protein FliH